MARCTICTADTASVEARYCELPGCPVRNPPHVGDLETPVFKSCPGVLSPAGMDGLVLPC